MLKERDASSLLSTNNVLGAVPRFCLIPEIVQGLCVGSHGGFHTCRNSHRKAGSCPRPPGLWWRPFGKLTRPCSLAPCLLTFWMSWWKLYTCQHHEGRGAVMSSESGMWGCLLGPLHPVLQVAFVSMDGIRQMV